VRSALFVDGFLSVKKLLIGFDWKAVGWYTENWIACKIFGGANCKNKKEIASFKAS
jgi:hypothetical protein